MDESKEEYTPTYGKLFNVLFHIGVIINVALVVWLYLLFFGVI